MTTTTLTIYLTPSQKEQVKKAAEHDGAANVSAYVREELGL